MKHSSNRFCSLINSNDRKRTASNDLDDRERSDRLGSLIENESKNSLAEIKQQQKIYTLGFFIDI